MLRNHLLVAARHFWNSKFYAAVHVLGLSIGLSASLVIFLIVRHELTYDKFEPGGDRIYRVVMDMTFNGMEGHSAAVPAPLAGAVADEATGIEAVAPVMQFQGDARIDVSIPSTGMREPLLFKKQAGVAFTTSDYFAIVPFTWLAGTPAHALDQPFTVVLSATRAAQYFPGLQPTAVLGRELRYGDDLQVTVAGVVDDLHHPTDFTNVEFISHATIAKTQLQDNFMMDVWNDWMAYSTAYVKLDEANNKAGAEHQLNGLLNKYNPSSGNAENTLAFVLQPLNDVHFNLQYAGFGQRIANKNTLLGLLAIAAFLVFLGVVNFVNLSTARASTRAKEIGIRKTIGSAKKQLVLQFMVENFLITGVASLLALSLAPLLLDVFSDFVPAGVGADVFSDPYTLLFVLLLTVAVGAVAGFYPALVLSRMRPAMVLKNSDTSTGHARTRSLRKVLTVSQFAVAQFFILAAFVVSKQIHYATSNDLGYRKEAIVSVPLPRDTVADHQQYLLQQIAQLPGVQRVSAGFLSPAMEGAAFADVTYNDGKSDVKIPVQVRWGDENYLPLFELTVVAGRNINADERQEECLINEAYAKALGFTDAADAVGHRLTFRGGTQLPIVGVMRDFHEGSFHQPIGPLVFKSGNQKNFLHVALANDGDQSTWPGTIDKMKQAFATAYPDGEFLFTFFDDTVARFYVQEQQTARLLNWSMALSLLISCMGLLGLVVFTSETRRKEIGIRKVFGASTQSIVRTLSGEFIGLVMIAFVVATPLAWYAAVRWLESFAYKTPVSWWTFAASGGVLLAVASVTLSFHTITIARSNPVTRLRNE